MSDPKALAPRVLERSPQDERGSQESPKAFVIENIERSPADWHIVATEGATDDSITAINRVTNNTYIGSMAGFNAAWKVRPKHVPAY